MTTKYLVLVPLMLWLGTPVLFSLPVNRRVGHFFVFWKTASQELLPNLEHLQRVTRHLIQKYFEEDLVNLTTGSFHSMDSAKDLSERLNLTKFPSQRVLNRENRTNFIFMKGLLKETYRLCYAYSKILREERKFRCDITNVFGLCDRTQDLEKGMRDVTEAIKRQLEDFFKVNASFYGTTRRERKVLAYIKKKRQADETEMNRAKILNDSMDDDFENSIPFLYRRRNRATVGLLYAVFLHLQDTEGTLQYALRLLEPPRDVE